MRKFLCIFLCKFNAFFSCKQLHFRIQPVISVMVPEHFWKVFWPYALIVHIQIVFLINSILSSIWNLKRLIKITELPKKIGPALANELCAINKSWDKSFLSVKERRKSIKKTTLAEMYSKPCGTSKMELFLIKG